MHTLKQLVRGILFFILALFGMAMAFIFMASSAIAIAVLYVVARIKGRPFGARAYWDQRRRPGTPKNAFRTSGDVIDIEMRELR